MKDEWFLTHLASERNMAASMHRRALSVLLFLYRVALAVSEAPRYAPTTRVIATATAEVNSQAPTRLSNPVSSARELTGGLRLKPTTNACAGRATTSRNATTKLMLSLSNRDQRMDITVPATTPASAAVMGVGVGFKLPDRFRLDSSQSTGASDAIGNSAPVSRCVTPKLPRTAKQLRLERIDRAHLGHLLELFVFAFRFRHGLGFECFGETIHAYEYSPAYEQNADSEDYACCIKHVRRVLLRSLERGD